jgi:hypothetical protein
MLLSLVKNQFVSSSHNRDVQIFLCWVTYGTPSIVELTDVVHRVACKLADCYEDQLSSLNRRPDKFPETCCPCFRKNSSNEKPSINVAQALEQIAQVVAAFAIESIVYGKRNQILKQKYFDHWIHIKIRSYHIDGPTRGIFPSDFIVSIHHPMNFREIISFWLFSPISGYYKCYLSPGFYWIFDYNYLSFIFCLIIFSFPSSKQIQS